MRYTTENILDVFEDYILKQKQTMTQEEAIEALIRTGVLKVESNPKEQIVDRE